MKTKKGIDSQCLFGLPVPFSFIWETEGLCLHCGDNNDPTAPETWLPHSSLAVYPQSFLVITSVIPSASQQYGVHLGYCQRSYLGSALCFCHVGSATSRGLISLCSFLGENLDFLKFRYIALYISSKSECCYC